MVANLAATIPGHQRVPGWQPDRHLWDTGRTPNNGDEANTVNKSRLGFVAISWAAAAIALLPGPLPAQKTKDPNVLTRAELLQSAQKSKDLYEAIRSLRPNFISPLTTRTQGAQSRALPKPVVYIDGALAGELDVLHSIMAENVEEVRFKSPSEAVELAPNAPGGAIMVTLHKGKP
jgi:hypothetical protein